MQFDWTISIGDVFQGGMLLIGLFIAYHKIMLRLSRLETLFDIIWNELFPDNRKRIEIIEK